MAQTLFMLNTGSTGINLETPDFQGDNFIAARTNLATIFLRQEPSEDAIRENIPKLWLAHVSIQALRERKLQGFLPHCLRSYARKTDEVALQA